tara:strand:- start:2170 stop:2361 length:192 start_codon:yes stop_codon:yes gene_type:complete
LFESSHKITPPTLDKGPDVKDVEYDPPTKLPALKSKVVKKFEFDAKTKYSSIKLSSFDDFVLT